MRVTLAEIATALDATLIGNGSIVIEGLAEPANARSCDLALATRDDYAKDLPKGNARAALVWPQADTSELGLEGALVPKRARYAMSTLTRLADPGQGFAPGIHASCVIDPTARIGKGVSIGPFSVVGANAEIGANTVIGPQCYIGARSIVGDASYLRDRVSIGADVRIGARVICQPGVIVGGDGFSFVTETTSTAEAAREALDGTAQIETDTQTWHRIHSLGGVVIGDDVEIGANTCIDSGTIRPTRIGDGTKIDNLVHIGHNCIVGRNCLICGQVGLAGSATLGDQVVLGGQVGISDNISVGDGVVAGGASKVLTNVPAGRAILGYPATKMDTHIESYKALRRLPRLMKDITALKKAVFKSDNSD